MASETHRHSPQYKLVGQVALTLCQSRLWFFLLIAIGTFSSVIYPHPPLVAFGASQAVRSNLNARFYQQPIWFTNQLRLWSAWLPSHDRGLCLEQWQWVWELCSSPYWPVRPDFSRVNLKGHYLWMLMSEIAGLLYLKASSCPSVGY